MNTMDRRRFLATSAVAVGMAGLATGRRDPMTPCVIATDFGVRVPDRAMEVLRRGADPAVAVVEAVRLIEDDPEVMSVGFGGLPNADGVVELDASVMHGPMHKAGAVAALRNIRNPAAVALEVLKRTDHVMLVGEGALRFAKMHGFEEQDLLTDKARQAWMKWKENLNTGDDWLDDDQQIDLEGGKWDGRGVPRTHGTINCCAVSATGDIAGVTTTSGLSYKLPGRVGDSPIIGAGLYVDNEIGAAGATGRGEAVIQNCGSFAVVQAMGDGLDPTQACLAVLMRIAERTRQPRLLDERGRPRFHVTLYAVRKDGAYGSASLHEGSRFAVNDGRESRIEPSAFLYERKR
jgi:N4-(beta-N-acetylglucosaminyl)-L-asparaginase